MIAQPIWDAIAAAAPEPDQPLDRQVERLFGPASTATEIYADQLPELATALNHLAAVDGFVESRGLRWAPTSEPAQRYPTDYGGQHGDEVKDLLDRAQRDYQAEPVILTGLARYEQLID